MAWLLKKFLINLLDVNDLFHPTSNIKPDHQPGELMAFDQHNALAEQLCCLFGRWRKRGRGDEETFAGLEKFGSDSNFFCIHDLA